MEIDGYYGSVSEGPVVEVQTGTLWSNESL